MMVKPSRHALSSSELTPWPETNHVLHNLMATVVMGQPLHAATQGDS